MAKLKEHWHGRKEALIKSIESGDRPDLAKELVRVEKQRVRDRGRHARERGSAHGSLKDGVQSKVPLSSKPTIPTIPTEIVGDVQLADIVKEIINDPKFKAQVIKSPGLMGTLINKVLGQGGEQTIIVEPIVLLDSQYRDSVKVLQSRPLGIQPSVPGEGLKIAQDLGKEETPTPPKSSQLDNSSIDSGKTSEIFGSEGGLTPQP